MQHLEAAISEADDCLCNDSNFFDDNNKKILFICVMRMKYEASIATYLNILVEIPVEKG